DGDWAGCRNHPAGGATPGQEPGSAGSSAPVCRGRGPAGWRPGSAGWASASGCRGPGTISPGGTGQYAAALPPTSLLGRREYYDSHSTGYLLYPPQTPVQAHISGKCHGVPILRLSCPNGVARG